jgi:hypothetical protein
MKPLAPERYKIQFTVDRDTHDTLRRVQDLLRHTIPDGDPAAIFDKAITLLLKEISKTKHAATDRPRLLAARRRSLISNCAAARTTRTRPAVLRPSLARASARRTRDGRCWIGNSVRTELPVTRRWMLMPGARAESLDLSRDRTSRGLGGAAIVGRTRTMVQG